MKPLKIVYQNPTRSEKLTMFVRPDIVERCAGDIDGTAVCLGDDIGIVIVCERVDDFVARWEEALADSTPIYIVDPPKVGGSPSYGKPNFERGGVWK